MKKTNQPKETMKNTSYDLEEAIFHTEEDFDLIPHKEKTKKKETMTNTNRDFKQAKKILTETINIAPQTSDVLVSYALMYSNLTDQGKKQAQEQLRLIGVNYDKMINQLQTQLKMEQLKGGK